MAACLAWAVALGAVHCLAWEVQEDCLRLVADCRLLVAALAAGWVLADCQALTALRRAGACRVWVVVASQDSGAEQ